MLIPVTGTYDKFKAVVASYAGTPKIVYISGQSSMTPFQVAAHFPGEEAMITWTAAVDAGMPASFIQDFPNAIEVDSFGPGS